MVKQRMPLQEQTRKSQTLTLFNTSGQSSWVCATALEVDNALKTEVIGESQRSISNDSLVVLMITWWRSWEAFDMLRCFSANFPSEIREFHDLQTDRS